MIRYKIWIQGRRSREWRMDGWFLFGFIPLWIRDCAPRGRYGRGWR